MWLTNLNFVLRTELSTSAISEDIIQIVRICPQLGDQFWSTALFSRKTRKDAKKIGLKTVATRKDIRDRKLVKFQNVQIVSNNAEFE